MKSRFLILAAIVFTLVACASNQIEYVKYENEQSVPRISAEDSKKEMDAGTAIFIDTRGEGLPDKLPGAIAMLSNAPPEKFNELEKGKKIIVYCS
ncbi:MAG: rhodanese-like domain-containing protein [Pyrinomonadaceae bacterium]